MGRKRESDRGWGENLGLSYGIWLSKACSSFTPHLMYSSSVSGKASWLPSPPYALADWRPRPTRRRWSTPSKRTSRPVAAASGLALQRVHVPADPQQGRQRDPPPRVRRWGEREGTAWGLLIVVIIIIVKLHSPHATHTCRTEGEAPGQDFFRLA